MEHNNHNHSHNHHDHDHGHNHTDSIWEELVHHFPYAIFSIAFGMIILSLLDYSRMGAAKDIVASSCSAGYHMLFHSFHFLHILFASTGAVITFSRFSKNITKMILIGTISPMFFCFLSDVLMPYLAGEILGVHMHLHICFHRELHNVLPFLFVGVLNGYLLQFYNSSMLRFFSFGSHFAHILISSLASLFYMVSHGFGDWYPSMGIIFLFLIAAIMLPCTLSDVIIPMYFARTKKD